MNDSVAVDRARLAEICRESGIRRLAVFGSALRADFRPDSDVDLLVEFDPTRRVSLLDLAAMEARLSAEFGRKVDLRTAAELSRYFRADVLRSADPIYAA